MATYNCSDSTNSAYGASSYGTCAEQTVGAPNTGVFGQFVGSSSFAIVAPLAGVIIAIVLISVAGRLIKKRKSTAQ